MYLLISYTATAVELSTVHCRDHRSASGTVHPPPLCRSRECPFNKMCTYSNTKLSGTLIRERRSWISSGTGWKNGYVTAPFASDRGISSGYQAGVAAGDDSSSVYVQARLHSTYLVENGCRLVFSYDAFGVAGPFWVNRREVSQPPCWVEMEQVSRILTRSDRITYVFGIPTNMEDPRQ
jgi:hypothetical protein